MRLALVESPYRASTAWELSRNLAYLRALLFDCTKRGLSPLAMHGLLTQVLDDRIPDERSLGIQCHIAWTRVADLIVIGTDGGISTGMQDGMDAHERAGRTVEPRALPGWRSVFEADQQRTFDLIIDLGKQDGRNYLVPMWVPSGLPK